jgi:hypothetical protein
MDEDNDQVLHGQEGTGSECSIHCTCPSEFAVRVGNGTVSGELNIPAFLVHVFCVSCKVEIPLSFDLGDAMDEEGTSAMSFTGECPMCGKDVEVCSSHHDADTPHPGGPVTVNEYIKHQDEGEVLTTAERLMKINARKRSFL